MYLYQSTEVECTLHYEIFNSQITRNFTMELLNVLRQLNVLALLIPITTVHEYLYSKKILVKIIIVNLKRWS